MAKRKVNKVSAMRIDEVSLVDLPANAGATVVLMKRGTQAPDGAAPETDDEDQDMAKTLEELAKALEDANDEIITLKKRAETAEAEAETLRKSKSQAPDKADTKQGSEPEDVLKALPEPLRKQFRDLQASNKQMAETLAKQQEAAETQEWIAKAASLDNLPAKSDDLGPLLRRVAKGMTTSEDADVLMKALTAANAMAAPMMREAGKTVAKAGSAEDQLYQRAAERVEKSNGTLTKAQAVNAILSEDKDLYSRYLAEQGR